MELFNLPITTKVNKVIPKNAFDSYTNPKQKKQFSELVSRITWLAKISKETVNLEPKEIIEIQIFKIELKRKEEINQLLNVIDKSIPYNIVFVVEFEDESYVSTSTKHPHPLNPDNAIIDWTFKSEWFTTIDNAFMFELKKNLDSVYHSFCSNINGNDVPVHNNLKDLIEYKRRIDSLHREISRLRSLIANTKQFNHRVELNLKLNQVEIELNCVLNKE